jgi:hypothetical protein
MHGHEHHRLPPSGEATVVLDIGESVGALVVHTPAMSAGLELEIARRGDAQAYTHTEVRERVLPEARAWAAVFAALPEGAYTLLDAPPDATCDVDVVAGRVIEVRW